MEGPALRLPAMGSHAGATAEGQKADKPNSGSTKTTSACPFIDHGCHHRRHLDATVFHYCDKNAYEVTASSCLTRLNRTRTSNSHESGLLKMICIGCRKHKGLGLSWTGYDSWPQPGTVAKAFLNKVNRLFCRHGPESQRRHRRLRSHPDRKFFERDAALQTLAKEDMPRLKLPLSTS